MSTAGKIIVGRPLTGAAMLMLAGLIAGCSTDDNLDATAARPAPPTVVMSQNAAGISTDTGPRKTGTYPSFSKPLTAANAQMSDADAADIRGQLQGLGHKRASGTISESEYKRRVEELRTLAKMHGQDTLSEIAN